MSISPLDNVFKEVKEVDTNEELSSKRSIISIIIKSMNNIELVKKVKASGSHFFDAKVMGDFNSKIVTTETTPQGFFITSEDTYDGKGTGYTIRQVLDSGEVVKKSGFNEFKCLSEAEKGLERLLSK